MKLRLTNPRLIAIACLAAVPLLCCVAKPVQGISVHENTTAMSSTFSQALQDFQLSTVKFNPLELTSALKDHQHEGWVLTAYPDPATKRPLIGAGFSLDVNATDHSQSDPLNPYPFYEPSSAELWEVAGLTPERLASILGRFHKNLDLWGVKRYRRKLRAHALPPDLTDGEAESLLRVSGAQAMINARAYCRDFDRLNASQQMALSELVFQMGVNLEHFVHFLNSLNGDIYEEDLSQSGIAPVSEASQWQHLQEMLVESQWATHYTTRASIVIAMFDPLYIHSPAATQAAVEKLLPAPTPVRSRSRSRATAIHASAQRRRVRRGSSPRSFRRSADGRAPLPRGKRT